MYHPTINPNNLNPKLRHRFTNLDLHNPSPQFATVFTLIQHINTLIPPGTISHLNQGDWAFGACDTEIYRTLLTRQRDNNGYVIATHLLEIIITEDLTIHIETRIDYGTHKTDNQTTIDLNDPNSINELDQTLNNFFTHAISSLESVTH